MKVLTGKVVDGKVGVRNDLEEGATVAILSLAPEPAKLNMKGQMELLDALTEIRSTDFVEGRDLLAELKDRAEG